MVLLLSVAMLAEGRLAREVFAHKGSSPSRIPHQLPEACLVG